MFDDDFTEEEQVDRNLERAFRRAPETGQRFSSLLQKIAEAERRCRQGNHRAGAVKT